jgi:hypothetical protein
VLARATRSAPRVLARIALARSPHTPAPLHTAQAIWEELQETVHAVDAMVTKTPAEMGG